MEKMLAAQAVEIVHTREMRLSILDSSSMRPSQLHNAMHPRVSRGPAAHATPWMHAYPWEPVMRWWSRFPTLRRWSRRDMHAGGCALFPRGDDTGPPYPPWLLSTPAICYRLMNLRLWEWTCGNRSARDVKHERECLTFAEGRLFLRSKVFFYGGHSNSLCFECYLGGMRWRD